MKQHLLWLFAAVTILILPATASTYPLRIWVMHNEIGARSGPVTKEQVREFTQQIVRDHNIIIENDVQNLMTDDALDEAYPLANYIIGRNEFLNELIRYHNDHEPQEPIAVEFLRWNDAYSKLSSIAHRGDVSAAPDVVQIGSTWVATFADRGTIADVSDHFDTDAFFPPSVASAHVFGEEGLFAVPWFVDTRVLYYWKDDIPAPDKLADWDGFLSTCAEVSRLHQKNFIGFPNTISWDLLHTLVPWLWAAGGDVLEPDMWGPIHGHRIVFDAPPAREGMAYLKKLSEAGCAAFPTIGHVVLEDRFIAREYATIITGPWFIRRLIDKGPGPDWQRYVGIALLPAGPNGTHPFVGGSDLAITTASTARGNAQRAIKLVQHLTGPAAQMAYTDATGMLPARRDALYAYMDRPETKVFRQALEVGNSYPSIPEWGSVVENDIIRNHIWHIWHDIATNAPPQALDNTIYDVAAALRHKLILALSERYAPYGGMALMMLSIAGGGSMWWWRRRYKRARRIIEQKAAQLKELATKRTVLEGTILLLKRRGERQSHDLTRLNGSLSSLKDKMAHLSDEFLRLKEEQQARDKRIIGPFAVRSDGTLAIAGEDVHFENNRQARRLIEHMARRTCRGTNATHCLWGYALFGWDPVKLQSPPQRLFEIMVSKINGRLKTMGKPPLIARVERRTPAWKLVWETGTVRSSSDMEKAMAMLDQAHHCEKIGDEDRAHELAVAAIRLDPKNVDALSMLRSLTGNAASLMVISQKLLGADVEMLDQGIASIEAMIAENALPRGIDPDDAERELRIMKFDRDYLRARCNDLFGERREHARSMLAAQVTSQMMAVKSEIASLTARGVAGEHLWASVVDGDNFTRLVSIPKIQSMVNGFYNHETEEHEDPRLIQLALISMISSSAGIDIEDSTTDEELFTAIRRGLSRQLASLESELSCWSAAGPC